MFIHPWKVVSSWLSFLIIGLSKWGSKMSRTPPPIHVFFPIKIDFVLFGKNLHKILRVCTDLYTNCLYLCVWKISYTSCITNGILASILYWIQYSSIFLYFFSYKIVSLQEKISRIQQQQNVPSKRLFLQHFKISKWLPFFIVCRKIHNRKVGRW